MRSNGHTHLRLGLEVLEGRVLPSATPMAFAYQSPSHGEQRSHQDTRGNRDSGSGNQHGHHDQDRSDSRHNQGSSSRQQESGYQEYRTYYFYSSSPGFFGANDSGPAAGPRGTQAGQSPARGGAERPINADDSLGDTPRQGRRQLALVPDGALFGRAGQQAQNDGNDGPPALRPAPIPLAQQGTPIPERRLAETRLAASVANLGADLPPDTLVLLGRNDPAPLRPRKVGAEAEAVVQERAAEESAEPNAPKASEPLRAALPAEGAGLLTEGLPISLSVLERALNALTESEPLSAGRAVSLLHWVGITTWVTAAAVAYYLVGRRRERAALDLLREDLYL